MVANTILFGCDKNLKRLAKSIFVSNSKETADLKMIHNESNVLRIYVSFYMQNKNPRGFKLLHALNRNGQLNKASYERF